MAFYFRAGVMAFSFSSEQGDISFPSHQRKKHEEERSFSLSLSLSERTKAVLLERKLLEFRSFQRLSLMRVEGFSVSCLAG